MYTFGDNVSLSTQSRTQQSALDQEAMNTTDPAKLRQLCQQGSKLACQFANMPEPTAEQEAQWAANRDADAQQQREATAQRLIDAGINPRIANAVRTGQDVLYAKDIEEAERLLRENYPPHIADEVLNDFYRLRTPWYRRTSTILAGAGVVTVVLAYLVLR